MALSVETSRALSLRDIVAVLCQLSPSGYKFSNARLTKMVYLADWKSALDREHQITHLDWIFNHYGPWVPDVVDAIRDDRNFKIEKKRNVYGGPKEQIRLIRPISLPNMPASTQAILQHVVNQTVDLNWSEFIRLVYSTYPVLSQPRYVDLDLPSLAKEYRQEMAESR